MGRLLLVYRLAVRDLRRRPGEAVLLFLALTAATATLTLALVLHGVILQPFQSTRAATAGPDVMASVAPASEGQPADIAALEALADKPGVIAHSGPFPYSQSELTVNGVSAVAWAQGRDTADAAVDQPALTDGDWVRDGGVVIEAGFAEALGADTGDQITLGGKTFEVVGIAVTANTPPYPKSCFAPCYYEGVEKPNLFPPPKSGEGPPAEAFFGGSSGLIWLTDADARGLVTTPDHLGYVMNLKLDDPASAQTFTDENLPSALSEPFVQSWQEILTGHTWVVETKQKILLTGSILLGLLALASIAVLVGGRMADQFRRVGLLKAVGGTPRLVAAVLLTEHLAIALVATAAGLAMGQAAAPLFTDPGTSLIGSAGIPPFSLATVGIVTAAALTIAALATVAPAFRAARTSTIVALSDSARPPRRTAWLTVLSARLPVPLLLGLRVASRRPRRTVLGMLAVAITTCGIIAALAAHANRYLTEKAPGDDPRLAISQALTLVTIMLIVQAGVNATCIAWTTILDTRRPAALARALGATPNQVSTGFAMAQALPALVGILFGIAGGIGLADILDEDPVTVPPLWQLLAVALGILVVIATLTALPARLSARRAVGEILQNENH